MNTHLFKISNDETTARESFAAHELLELLKLLLIYFAKVVLSFYQLLVSLTVLLTITFEPK
jgi:hypothetical protein